MDSKAYYEIWNRIERAAFVPDENRVGNWLTAYNSFLNRITGKQDSKWLKKRNGKFRHSLNYKPLDLQWKYEISRDFSGFSFRITQKDQTFLFEYSNKEYCEFDYLIEHCDNRAQNINHQDLTEVIKQKIVHPAIHLHLTNDEELHEIRLGVATKNPFVFLYQFAFQMIAEKDGEDTLIRRYSNSPQKQQEINRLADLIGEEIDNGRISPGKLLGIS